MPKLPTIRNVLPKPAWQTIRAIAANALYSPLCPLILLTALIILLRPILAYAAPPAQEPGGLPSVSRGRVQWAENCQPCHGPTGRGDGPTAQSIPNPLPDFTDPETARLLVPAQNFEVIKNGRIDKLMPPWGNRLSDAEIWDAVAQVWSLSTTSQNLAAGETIYLEQCAACHGQNGTGNGPEAPAEINDFTDLQVMARQSQADLLANFLGSNRHAQFSNLSNEEMWQVLDYIRTFTFIVPRQNGVLRGQVINGTTNQPVGNVPVTLRVFEGNNEIETLTTQADGQGRYTFEKLATDHSRLYVVEAPYQNISYFSDEPAIFVPDSAETTLDLKVYEPTTTAKDIKITQMHYLISFAPGQVQVVQIFVVGNGDNHTFVGEDGQTFAFLLPEGASNVAFQNDLGGTRFIQTGAGYVDTEPIKPGPDGLSIVASYDIPYDDDSLTIEVPLPADVITLNLLVQEMGANVSSDQLQFVDSREVQGDTFAIFNGTNLRQGQTVVLNLTDLEQLEFAGAPNLPVASVPGNPADQNLLRWIVLGLIGLVIVATSLIYPQMRPKLTGQAEIQPADPTIRRQKLLLTLARLDQLFEAGDLDEAVYRRARAKYKAELAEIMEADS